MRGSTTLIRAAFSGSLTARIAYHGGLHPSTNSDSPCSAIEPSSSRSMRKARRMVEPRDERGGEDFGGVASAAEAPSAVSTRRRRPHRAVEREWNSTTAVLALDHEDPRLQRRALDRHVGQRRCRAPVRPRPPRRRCGRGRWRADPRAEVAHGLRLQLVDEIADPSSAMDQLRAPGGARAARRARHRRSAGLLHRRRPAGASHRAGGRRSRRTAVGRVGDVRPTGSGAAARGPRSG